MYVAVNGCGLTLDKIGGDNRQVERSNIKKKCVLCFVHKWHIKWKAQSFGFFFLSPALFFHFLVSPKVEPLSRI